MLDDHTRPNDEQSPLSSILSFLLTIEEAIRLELPTSVRVDACYEGHDTRPCRFITFMTETRWRRFPSLRGTQGDSCLVTRPRSYIYIVDMIVIGRENVSVEQP